LQEQQLGQKPVELGLTSSVAQSVAQRHNGRHRCIDLLLRLRLARVDVARVS